jgi:hypothetical protein
MSESQLGADQLKNKVLDVPDSKTIHTQALTKDAEDTLTTLGYHVKTLPDGTVDVTADTTRAMSALTSFINRYQNYDINLGVNASYVGADGKSHQYGRALAKATGGVLPGFTPGSDVHHFVSPTGGALSLSGGEAVMRPEFTAAVGSGWVDGVNAAARSGGVAGVRTALGFADGGILMHLLSNVTADTSGLDSGTEALMSALAGAAAASMISAPGAPGNVSANAALAQRVAAARGWVGAEWNALYALGNRESGWNNTAQNPTSTAYGIPQFLDSTWATVGMRKTSDPAAQIEGMDRYIEQRYADPIRAWAHETSAGWYHGGGPVPGSPGADVPAVLQAGETVRTVTQEATVQKQLRSREVAGGGSSGTAPVVNFSLENATVTGRFELGADGFVTLVDGRITQFMGGLRQTARFGVRLP